MSCILAVKLGFRARAGHHIHVAADIRGIYVAGSVEITEGSSADCYFCLAKTEGHNSRCKATTVYPNIPSALRPVKHYDSLPVRKPPQQWTLHEEELTSTSPEDEPGPSMF